VGTKLRKRSTQLLKGVLILLDQANDLSKSAKLFVEHYCIVYLVFVGEFKQNVTHHFGECLKKMVSHTELKNGEK
jgi:hypothetical protein